jgi:hypothetical protein
MLFAVAVKSVNKYIIVMYGNNNLAGNFSYEFLLGNPGSIFFLEAMVFVLI